MSFGFQLTSWRRFRGFNQAALAHRANLSRPYLSRLERDEIDPCLSTLRRIAAALNASVGELLEVPPVRMLDRHELDALARYALQPALAPPEQRLLARRLSRAFQTLRAAWGYYRPRKPSSGVRREGPGGLHVMRQVRSELGDRQWEALVQRIDKLAPLQKHNPRSP